LRNIRNLFGGQFKIAALRSGKGETVHDDVIKLLDFEFHSEQESLEFAPEVVIVCNHSAQHIETVQKYLGRAKYLFVEKPISHSLERREEIEEKVAEKGIITYVACPLRFHPVVRYLKEQKEGLGKLYYVIAKCSSYLPEWQPGRDYRKSFRTRKEQGGGVALELAHEIDYVRWIFGDIKSGFFYSGHVSDLATDCDDLTVGVFEFAEGGVCEIHLDFVSRVSERSIKVSGENGHFEGDLLAGEVSFLKGSETQRSNFDFERNDMYVNEMKYFFESIRENRQTFNDFGNAFETVKYALMLRDSAKWRESI
jgi:predicted dehydrogenase